MSIPLLAQVDIKNTPLGAGSIGTIYSTPATLINLIVKNSLTIAGILLLVLLLFGGLNYIIGAGKNDPKKTQQSQETITAALIGFAVVFLAFIIVQIIEIITGVQILSPNI